MSTSELTTTDILAAQRTRLASERTLMAWIRTATSMISFGFSIAKALQYAIQQGVIPKGRGAAPEGVGLTLIILAVVSLIFASIQHWQFVRGLPAITKGAGRWDLALTMAGVITILGLLILVNIIYRVGPF